MTDFLTFKTFISVDVLITIYYLLALLLPGSILAAIWQLKKNRSTGGESRVIRRIIGLQNRAWLIVELIVILGLSELFLRMLFEFLIAYIQIRDALVSPG